MRVLASQDQSKIDKFKLHLRKLFNNADINIMNVQQLSFYITIQILLNIMCDNGADEEVFSVISFPGTDFFENQGPYLHAINKLQALLKVIITDSKYSSYKVSETIQKNNIEFQLRVKMTELYVKYLDDSGRNNLLAYILYNL